MYFLTVARLIPNSRAIPRMDMPLRFAFCMACHRTFWRNVAFRGGMATTLPAAVPWSATKSCAVSFGAIRGQLGEGRRPGPVRMTRTGTVPGNGRI